MNYELISAIIFYSLMGVYVYLKRKEMDVEYKIFFLLRTKKFIHVMYRIGTRFAKVIKALSSFGIIIGFVFLIMSVSILFNNAFNIVSAPEKASKMTLLIPGIPTGPISLPLWYGLISLTIASFVH